MTLKEELENAKENLAKERLGRLNRAVSYLTSTEKVSQTSTQKDIARLMGYNNSTNVNYAFKGNVRYMTEGFLRRFNKAFDDIFSEEWLLSGEGKMLKNSVPVNNEAVPILQDVVYVPLVNQFAYAGYLDGYTDVTYLNQLPQIPFIVDREGHGNYIAFEVKGDSMNDGTEDSYLEGDRLYCREVAPYLWATSKLHLRKWDFVIVHAEGIIVKRIIDHNVENHTITIHSLNDMYEDKVIDLCEVKQIFNVIESVRPRRR
ncbi:S24 family peptidase [Bacteroides sp.]|uniref:S24 family peptidase n=1 Tax=Bacteroides sp. TaxID=29523 RepID=UPI00261BF86F|nr:S24 family peptidase [Bacteroides sp.]